MNAENRFTKHALEAFRFANQEAQRLNHEYIGTEHLLLGLLRDAAFASVAILNSFDIDLSNLCLEIERICPAGPAMMTMGKMPQTPRSKKAIEYALEEAESLGSPLVGTESLLLGLMREQEGAAAQVLMATGLTFENVKRRIVMGGL